MNRDVGGVAERGRSDDLNGVCQPPRLPVIRRWHTAKVRDTIKDNFLQIIVMIIINYYYIIYNYLNYFARANAVRKVYKYSRTQTCRLTVFCVKLT